MLNITLTRHSKLNRDYLFNLSTNIENFAEIFHKYFKSIKILEKKYSENLVLEKISFFGITMFAIALHTIVNPNLHNIEILTGPLRGSKFLEIYENSKNGTIITITVSLQFTGISKVLSFFPNILKYQINKMMDEFIVSCERLKNNMTHSN